MALEKNDGFGSYHFLNELILPTVLSIIPGKRMTFFKLSNLVFSYLDTRSHALSTVYMLGTLLN